MSEVEPTDSHARRPLSPLADARAALHAEAEDRFRFVILLTFVVTVFMLGLSTGFLVGGRARSADWVEAAGTWVASLSSIIALVVAAYVFLTEKMYRDHEIFLQQQRDDREFEQAMEEKRALQQARLEDSRKQADRVRIAHTYVPVEPETGPPSWHVEFTLENNSEMIISRVSAIMQDLPNVAIMAREVLDGDTLTGSFSVERTFQYTDALTAGRWIAMYTLDDLDWIKSKANLRARLRSN